jgi:serine/threonine protein kinase
MDQRVRQYVTDYPELIEAKDVLGRLAKDVATPANKAIMRSISLVHGRYRVTACTPLHMSATCFVYEALDELHKDDEGNEVPIKVVLKLMKTAAQFVQEISAREQAQFDTSHVVSIWKYHAAGVSMSSSISSSPSSSSLPAADVPDVSNEVFGKASKVISEGKLLPRGLVEQFHLVVLPFGERNMYAALKHERFAGHDMRAVKHIFSSIVRCVEGMHSQGFIHGDIKPLNLVRIDGAWKLIDLDASVPIGSRALMKYSTAYLPPESLVRRTHHVPVPQEGESSPEGGATVVSTSITVRMDSHALPADPSLDVWSLGCLLYQLCHPHVLPLFQAGQDDNLETEVDLHNLWEWTDTHKQAQLARIIDPMARNLLALMLTKDPLLRPTLARVLVHPFISGNTQVARLPGAEPEYDCFLSYRVASDLTENNHVEKLYDLLVARGLRVFWDRKCLPLGEPWEKHFFAGIVKSRTFVSLLSKDAINHPDIPRQNFSQLTEDSDCDNVYLEHRAALELRDLGYIERVIPVFIGTRSPDTGLYSDLLANGSGGMPNAPDCKVAVVEQKLVEHMNAQALGTPLKPDRSVKSVLGDIRACHGAKITGNGDEAFKAAADEIVGVINECKALLQRPQREVVSETEKALLASNKELQAALDAMEKVLADEKSANAELRALVAQHRANG